MSATSLKLPDDLRKRIQTLVSSTNQTAQGFMVEAIATATERAELRRRFGEEAEQAERETLESGKAYDANEVFAYLKARAAGNKAKRARPKAWQRSS